MTTVGSYKFVNGQAGIISVKNRPILKKTIIATMFTASTVILYLFYLAADKSFLTLSTLFVPISLLVLLTYLILFKLLGSPKASIVCIGIALLILILMPFPIKIFSLGSGIPIPVLVIGLYLIPFTLLPCYLANLKYEFFMDPQSRMIGERTLLKPKIQECGLGPVSGFTSERIALNDDSDERSYRFDIFAVGQHSKKHLFSEYSEEQSAELVNFLKKIMKVDDKTSDITMLKLIDNDYKIERLFQNWVIPLTCAFIAVMEIYTMTLTLFL